MLPGASGWRNPQHDIPFSGQLDVCHPGWLEFGRHQVTISFGHALVEKIARITRLTGHVELGGELWFAFRDHCEVDVGCPTGIWCGTYRPEPVVALTVGACVSETLESRVDGTVTRIAWVPIAAIGVALPDLDTNIIQRSAVAVENTSGQIRDLPPGRLFPTLDAREVIVIVQGPLHWIKRTGGLAGGGHPQPGWNRYGVDRHYPGGTLKETPPRES